METVAITSRKIASYDQLKLFIPMLRPSPL